MHALHNGANHPRVRLLLLVRLHTDDGVHWSRLGHRQPLAIECRAVHAPHSSGGHGLTPDRKLRRGADEVLVLAIAPVAGPTAVALVASSPPRRDGARNANVDKLVELRRPFSSQLGQARPVDCARALGRDPVEEAAENALALLLLEVFLGRREATLLARPLV